MNKPDKNLTVIAPKYDAESELNRFAKLFHQDFDIMDCEPDEFALGFFRSLSVEEKASLKNELIKILVENPGKKQRGLLNSWFRFGAEWWDQKLDLRQSIENWIAEL